MDGIGNIQIHDSQWIRQADLDMKHLVVKGIALQQPTFDHGRTHPVEVPWPAAVCSWLTCSNR